MEFAVAFLYNGIQRTNANCCEEFKLKLNMKSAQSIFYIIVESIIRTYNIFYFILTSFVKCNVNLWSICIFPNSLTGKYDTSHIGGASYKEREQVAALERKTERTKERASTCWLQHICAPLYTAIARQPTPRTRREPFWPRSSATTTERAAHTASRDDAATPNSARSAAAARRRRRGAEGRVCVASHRQFAQCFAYVQTNETQSHTVSCIVRARLQTYVSLQTRAGTDNQFRTYKCQV